MSDQNPNPTGYFVFSLDTELAWGYFDLDARREATFSPDGSRERKSILRVLDLCNEFGITGTWALVGHLFHKKCVHCEICPVLEWKGKYRSFEQIYDTDHPLWYWGDLVDHLLACDAPQEVAFHGYTHDIFDERTMSREKARVEIQEWLRLAEPLGITPRSIVFTRDRVGHLDLFKEAGFTCYRSDVKLPIYFRTKYGGSLIKSVDHILGLSTPPVYDLEVQPSGLVNLPTSQHIFAFNRKLETMLDNANLPTLRLRRIVKAIRKAAAEKKIVHIWAHPWEFRTEKDFEKLRYLLRHAAEEINKGRLRSIGMAELADIALTR
ncbi:MAG: hypothetical protein JXB47_00105 [Anaerolineae bacterium]|nr:hypothetical protein [Anaerolineae bacterium]